MSFSVILGHYENKVVRLQIMMIIDRFGRWNHVMNMYAEDWKF